MKKGTKQKTNATIYVKRNGSPILFLRVAVCDPETGRTVRAFAEGINAICYEAEGGAFDEQPDWEISNGSLEFQGGWPCANCEFGIVFDSED